MSHLAENSFPVLAHLHTVDLSNNPTKAILPYAFGRLNSTRNLYVGSWDWRNDRPLADGRYVEIYSNSFFGLDALEQLHVGPVSVTSDQGLGPQHLRGLGSLTELRIRGRLGCVQADTFAASAAMHTLDLSNCSLRTVSMDAFQGLAKLRVLDLSANGLVQLLGGLFDPLVSLKELWLNDNRLTTLADNIFHPLTSAKLIRLTDNPWHCTCQLDQLRPTSVNKLKTADPLSNRTRFAYEKKVAPLCHTPAAFHGASVFDVLRKDLRCSKKLRETDKYAASFIRSLRRRATATTNT